MICAPNKFNVKIENDFEFNKQLIEVFGEDHEDEEVENSGKVFKSLTLKDFRILSNSGNDLHATARCGEYYLYFIY